MTKSEIYKKLMKAAPAMNWSQPRKVTTKKGERHVLNGRPSPAFWEAWKSKKNTLKAAGFSVTKYKGNWQVALWIGDNINLASAISILDQNERDDEVCDECYERPGTVKAYDSSGIAGVICTRCASITSQYERSFG